MDGLYHRRDRAPLLGVLCPFPHCRVVSIVPRAVVAED